MPEPPVADEPAVDSQPVEVPSGVGVEAQPNEPAVDSQPLVVEAGPMPGLFFFRETKIYTTLNTKTFPSL